jgi:hypothetical protein
MNKENTNYLLKRYRSIFRNHKKSITESCMAWLFECGDGWFLLLDTLCDAIKQKEDYYKKYKKCKINLIADQIKEKFASLRFYYHIEFDKSIDEKTVSMFSYHVDGLIEMAERMSSCICEICGNKGEINKTGFWLSTLCEKCRKENNEQRTVKKNKK